jgi:hypothetical protein
VGDPDGWRCRVCVDGDAEPKAGRICRASNKGYLPLGFETSRAVSAPTRDRIERAAKQAGIR